jgi:drug/metabolite transporter (DMT)-like permease
MLSLYITNSNINTVSIIILPLTITCIIQNSTLISNDRSHLEQILVSGCSSTALSLAKFLVIYITLCISATISLSIFFILKNTLLDTQIQILKICFIYAIPLSSVALTTSALTARCANNWLGLIIALPLFLIFFMYLSSLLGFYLEATNIPNYTSTDLQLLLSLALISFITSICACSYLITEI